MPYWCANVMPPRVHSKSMPRCLHTQDSSPATGAQPPSAVTLSKGLNKTHSLGLIQVYILVRMLHVTTAPHKAISSGHQHSGHNHVRKHDRQNRQCSWHKRSASTWCACTAPESNGCSMWCACSSYVRWAQGCSSLGRVL